MRLGYEHVVKVAAEELGVSASMLSQWSGIPEASGGQHLTIICAEQYDV